MQGSIFAATRSFGGTMNTDRQLLERIRDHVIAARVALSAVPESGELDVLDPEPSSPSPALLHETEQELCFEMLPVEEEVLKAA